MNSNGASATSSASSTAGAMNGQGLLDRFVFTGLSFGIRKKHRLFVSSGQQPLLEATLDRLQMGRPPSVVDVCVVRVIELGQPPQRLGFEQRVRLAADRR